MAVRSKARGLWQALRAGLGWGLLALVAGLGVAVIAVPAATGSVPLAVLTGSMEPTLPVGTMVVVRPTPVDEIRLGDVLTYQIVSGQAAVVSHRVIEIRNLSTGSREFITQGDNNNAPDPMPVTPDQIKGRVWYSLPAVGWLSIAVGSYGSWLAPVAGGALLLYAGGLFISSLIGRARRARSAALTD